MKERKAFDLGVLAGLLLANAGWSGNWLITPMNHPEASPLRRAAVAAQALVCLGVALLLILRWRPRSSASPAV
jgi:hypothetical protein